jgi:predicted DsbA family dithiol-disulfide isomerase
MHTIQVEIWSDYVCPFCYIGKRQFEEAIRRFGNQSQVDVHWRSFQLDPEARPEAGQKALDYLAERKGWTLEQVRQVTMNVSEMAKSIGLDFRMEEAVMANSLNAHRLMHFAQQHGLQENAGERLFAAHFTEAKDLGNLETLALLGEEIGLDKVEVSEMLKRNDFLEEVQYDIYQARQVGLSGVPFFVFQNKYVVSGARGTETFLQILEALRQEVPEL